MAELKMESPAIPAEAVGHLPVGSERAAAAAAAAQLQAAQRGLRGLPSLLPRRQFAVEPSPYENQSPQEAEELRRRSQAVYESFFRFDGPVDDIIDDYDRFALYALPGQIASKVIYFEDKRYITFEVERDERTDLPTYALPHVSGNAPLYPRDAIDKELTYQFDVRVTATRRDPNGEPTAEEKNPYTFRLGSIPAMVGSRAVCWTRNLDVADPAVRATFHLSGEEAARYQRGGRIDPLVLERMGLDRTNVLSYFIIGGDEYVVLLNEKLRMNTVMTYWVKRENRRVTSMKCSTSAGSVQVRVAHVVKAKHEHEEIRVLELLPTAGLAKRQTQRAAGGIDFIKGAGVVAVAPAGPAPEEIPAYINVYHIFHLYGIGDDASPFATYEGITKFILQFVDPLFHDRARALLAATIFDFRSAAAGGEGQDRDPTLFFFARRYNLPRERDRLAEMKAIFRDELFPQANVGEAEPPDPTNLEEWLERAPENERRSNERRMLLLGFMVGRHLMMELGAMTPEDKNSWANNFLLSAGKVMEVEFNCWWANVVGAVQESVHSNAIKATESLKTITGRLARDDNLIATYITAFKQKKWEGFDRTALSTTLVEPFRTETWGSVLSQISAVNVKANRRVRNVSLRMIQPTQAGYFCPAETPERDNCGLVKHKSIGCRLSREAPDSRERILAALGAAAVPLRAAFSPGAAAALVVNGVIEGWTDGQRAVDALRASRRGRAGIPKDTALVYTRDRFLRSFGKPIVVREDVLYAYADEGRPVRPLFIVEGAELAVDRRSAETGEDYWKKPFEELLDTGCAEYVDAWESEMGAFVAQSPWHLVDIRGQLDEARRLRRRLAEELQRLLAEIPDTQQLPEADRRRLAALEVALSDRMRGLDQLRAEDRAREVAEAEAEIARLQEQVDAVVGQNVDLVGLRRRVDAARDAFKNASSNLADLEQAQQFTHCEIHPASMWGAGGSSSVLPDHTYAPRNTFFAQQFKSAIGIPNVNYLNRFDKIKVLAYPTLPLFETMTDDLFNSAVHPAGMEVVVAEMLYTGYTQEDAIIMNRGAIDRGLFVNTKFSDYRTNYSVGSSPVRLMNPSTVMIKTKTKDGTTEQPLIAERLCRAINKDGLPVVGKEVKEGDILVGRVKVFNEETGQLAHQDASLRLKATDAGVIDGYMISQAANGDQTIRVRVASRRVPVVGDKFTDREGQKATIGIILPPEDMPFFDSGVVPDIIVNPHALSSRMTVNKVMEILVGKAAALRGERYDATAFQNFSLAKFYQALKLHGFQEHGVEVAHSGFTGEKIMARVFVGMSHYYSLRHQAMDKIQFRGSMGSFNPESKEPVGGVGKAAGAARFSELERHALVAHGVSAILADRTCASSNPFEIAVCTKCHRESVFSVSGYECPRCGPGVSSGKVKMKYAQKWTTDILRALHVNARYRARPASEAVYFDLFRQIGFAEPPPGFAREIESYRVVKVLLARPFPEENGVTEVLAHVDDYTSLLLPVVAQVTQDLRRGQGRGNVAGVIDQPRATDQSYFLARWGVGPNSRVNDFRQNVLRTAKLPGNGEVIRTTNLETVWKELLQGRLTNPE
jgi:DNA-directed RNA polymerase beta subunit